MTKRISDEMENLLNEQLTREAYQAQVYLSFGSWAEVNGFPGISAFFYKHALEERQHMFKFLKYINDRGGHARIQAIDAPPADPSDIANCLERTLQHEVDNSAQIDKIIGLAHDEKDWATFSFGQWFAKEQIEEENLIREVVDRYALASDEQKHNANLYALDRDMENASQEAPLAREAEL